jgi:hypothetical protein
VSGIFFRKFLRGLKSLDIVTLTRLTASNADYTTSYVRANARHPTKSGAVNA